MQKKLKKSDKVEIVDLTISFSPPVPSTKEQVDEWIDFQITGGSMSASNPLVGFDLKDLVNIGHASFIEYKTRLLS